MVDEKDKSEPQQPAASSNDAEPVLTQATTAATHASEETDLSPETQHESSASVTGNYEALRAPLLTVSEPKNSLETAVVAAPGPGPTVIPGGTLEAAPPPSENDGASSTAVIHVALKSESTRRLRSSKGGTSSSGDDGESTKHQVRCPR